MRRSQVALYSITAVVALVAVVVWANTGQRPASLRHPLACTIRPDWCVVRPLDSFGVFLNESYVSGSCIYLAVGNFDFDGSTLSADICVSVVRGDIHWARSGFRGYYATWVWLDEQRDPLAPPVPCLCSPSPGERSLPSSEATRVRLTPPAGATHVAVNLPWVGITTRPIRFR